MSSQLGHLHCFITRFIMQQSYGTQGRTSLAPLDQVPTSVQIGMQIHSDRSASSASSIEWKSAPQMKH